MNAINKRKLLKQLADNGLFIFLPSWQFSPNVVDKLLDITIENGHILGGILFIHEFSDFNNIYKGCAIDDKNEQELNNYFKLIDIYMYINKLHNHSINSKTSSLLINVYNLFDDKKKSFQTLSAMIDIITKFKIEKEHLLKYLANINQYLLSSRKYYSDEVIYLSRLISELEPILNSDDLIDDLIKQDKKIAGIYDIDEERIDNIEKKLNEFDKQIQNLDNKINSLLSSSDDIEKDINEYSVKIKKELIEYKKEILNEINPSYKKNNNQKVSKENEISNYSLLNDFLLQLKNKNIRIYDSVVKANKWFYSDEVINLFGANFLLNLNYYEYSILTEFYNANGLNILKKIIDYNNSFMENFSFYLLNFSYPSNFFKCNFLSIINKISIKKFANLNTNQLCCIFELVDNNALLNKMIQILQLNPKIAFNDYYIIELLECFDAKFLANADSELQRTFEILGYDFDKLKEILEINPSFRIFVAKFDINVMNILGKEIVAFSDKKRQNTINLFNYNENCLTKLHDILTLNKYFNLYEIDNREIFAIYMTINKLSKSDVEIVKYEVRKTISIPDKLIEILSKCTPEEIIYFNNCHLFEKIISLSFIKGFDFQLFENLPFDLKRKLLAEQFISCNEWDSILFQASFNKTKEKIIKTLTKKLW